jgi:hypothetical protein
MNYNELVQLYFERSNALQSYWTLYVVIVGGLLAFSSLRKDPSPLTTLIVSILFALFAFENLSAIQNAASQRFATLDAIKKSEGGAPEVSRLREALEPTLTPASHSSTRTTHLVSDILTIAALWAMEMRRRKSRAMA